MPITRPIDTLVLGGGMAGTFAALAAKTPDTTVAIVEPANVLGTPADPSPPSCRRAVQLGTTTKPCP